MPVWVVTRAPASPADWTDSTISISPSVLASAAGSEAVAMMSRSLTESALRRSEPATSTRSDAGCARSAPTICSAIGTARDSRIRGAGPPSSSCSARTRLRFSSAFGPNPRSPRIWPASAAARSASSESTPISSYSRRARFGPKPGRCMTDSSPLGNLARSFTAAGISPVSSSARSFSSSVLPIPGTVVTLPSRVIAMIDTDESRTALAALRYAMTR